MSPTQPEEEDEATAVSDSASRPSGGAVQPGDVVAEKYKITSILGKGGMGIVAAAEHLQLKETVALKFLLSATENDKEFRARFLREAQVSAKLRGEHVVRVMDFGAPQGAPPFIVMEHLTGTDVRELLNAEGKLPLEVALDFVAQACEGVAEAHAKDVVHRDLKPSNLFVSKRLDGSDLVKILDFGVSKLRTQQDVDEELTSAGTLLGSPRYMSPEQLQNSMDVDAGTDIWALGAILFEMIAGRPPFQSGGGGTAALIAKILGTEPPPTFESLGVSVPKGVEAAIRRCLERDRAKRTPDVGSFVQELADATSFPWLRHAAGRIHGVLQHRSRADTGAVSTVSQRLSTATRTAGEGRPPLSSSSGVASASGVSRSEEPPPKAKRGRLVGTLVVVGVAAFGIAWLVGKGGKDQPRRLDDPRADAPRVDRPPGERRAHPVGRPVRSARRRIRPGPPAASTAAAPPDDPKKGKRPTPGAPAKPGPTATAAPPPTVAAPPPKSNPLGDRF